jgi:hypothetical protein
MPQQHGLPIARVERQTARQIARDGRSTGERICALAFADDICLLAPSELDLQHLFTFLEENALAVGLRINMGAGKTERFSLGCVGKDGSVRNLNVPIPIVESYKYLGVYALDCAADWRMRVGRAWAALTKYAGIWRAKVDQDVKRQLFRALVEPILTYGLVAYAPSVSFERKLDAAYNRMLRYALGLPPVVVSREVKTELLYSGMDYISATVAQRRITLLGHVARDHFEQRARHPLVQILFHDLRLKRRRGRRSTIVGGLLREAKCADLDELWTLLLDRDRTRAAAKRALDDATTRVDARIRLRRAAEARRVELSV